MFFRRNAFIYLGVSLIYLMIMLLMPSAEAWIKPMLMPALILFYFLEAESVDRFLLRALIACWAGDVLLMLENQSPVFFLSGLVVFLIGHVMYILSMRRMIRTDIQHVRPEQTLLIMTLVTGVASIVWILVKDNAGDLLYPITVYVVVVISMFFHALRRRSRTTRESFLFMVFGALAFFVSDSILALNRYYEKIPFAGPVIMVTYLLAQYFLVAGAMKHKGQPAF